MSPTRATAADLADLVRLPAVLSVPGDVLAGASLATDRPPAARTAALAGASCLLYLGGMALNDVADVDVDRDERPHRPIPSGRVPLPLARRLALGLLGAGVGLAAAGGRRSVAVALPLAGAVAAYDLGLKNTAAGPLAMSACRTLDVLLGASLGSPRRAAPAAAAIGLHTYALTTVSRHETTGGRPDVVRGAALAGLLATAATAHLAFWRARPGRRALGLLPLVAHAAVQVRAAGAAVREPTPATAQRLVGTSVLGFVPLQGALTLARGPRLAGAALTALWPLAHRLARRRSVT
ncbi:SCO3242 family prenyltransferase [Egicoccus halophilus]|uniref:Transferase n=1 Tax=Egicoccus halophilus TaxID=1670830 RepID=A0A8J3A5T8_9ACTN|nr:UbiA family prenyltransferase [Egicoccus halophilus]GGI03457.1 transferase [Egicoccus halophilus]